MQASGWAEGGEQMDLLGEDRHQKWKETMAAADRMRDKFGESAVSLASSLRGKFRERTQRIRWGCRGETRAKGKT